MKLRAFAYLGLFLLGFGLFFAQGQSSPSIESKYVKSIAKLKKSKEVKRAFQEILALEDKTLERHIALTEIPAPPFKEQKRAVAMQEYFTSLGADFVWIDEVGNVLALVEGSKGNLNIAVDAHLDTVFPESTDVRVRIQNDTLYAPGIADDTRGLSMLLTLLETLRTTGIQPEHNLLLIASVGEEGLGDLRGVKHLFRKDGPKIDKWISVDGGSLARVNNQGLGSYRYRVHFDSPGGHSWGAFGLANPHHALGGMISKFVQYADAYTKSGPKTSYNIGTIRGGTSVNSIPFESVMEVDIRSIEPSRLDDMEELLKQAANEALTYQNSIKRRGPDLSLRIDKIGNRPSGKLSESLPLIQSALAASQSFGAEPQLTIGSTNSNIPISKNIPAVTIGIGGRGGKAHSLDEWWTNDNGHLSIQMLLLLTLSQTGIN